MKTFAELSNFVNSLYDDDIEILQAIIDTIDISNTMNNVVHQANSKSCPYCNSREIIKNGKKMENKDIFVKIVEEISLQYQILCL